MFGQLSLSRSISFSHSARASDVFIFPCILTPGVCAAILRIQLGFLKTPYLLCYRRLGVSGSLLSRAQDAEPFIFSIVTVRVSETIQAPFSPLGLGGHFPGCPEPPREVE